MTGVCLQVNVSYEAVKSHGADFADHIDSECPDGTIAPASAGESNILFADGVAKTRLT